MKSGYTYIRLAVEAAPPKPTSSNPVINNNPPPSPSTTKTDRTSTVTSTQSSLKTSSQNATVSSSAKPEFFMYAAVGGLLLLIILTGIIWWRYRAQRQMEGNERKTECRKDQETQNEVLFVTVNEDKWNKVKETDNCEVLYAAQDDVTYSTVVHNRRSTPATVLLDTEETTEYASIKLN
ncbi:hypothetical protein MHYP_G00050520 [Metynnis hypsauchen]